MAAISQSAVEVFGWGAVAGLVLLYVPDTILMLWNKTAPGFSWIFLAIRYFATISFLFYGIGIGSTQVIVINATILICLVFLTIGKFKFNENVVQDKDEIDTIHAQLIQDCAQGEEFNQAETEANLC